MSGHVLSTGKKLFLKGDIKMLRVAILISVFFLSACATMPSGPSVLVLPGTGKSYDQFHTDDQTCRQLAHTQITTSPKQPSDSDEGQQNYDIIYIQCMYGKGHRVPVPGELMYDTQQDWNPPPPANMPSPPPAAGSETGDAE
jgi:hypothetical protein